MILLVRVLKWRVCIMANNMRPDLETIGRNIAKFRKGKGYTQKKLGELLCIQDKTISKWEKGVVGPDITILSDIAYVLNISKEEAEKLYEHAKKLQIEIGCHEDKCMIISNGIHFDKYSKRLYPSFSLAVIFITFSTPASR